MPTRRQFIKAGLAGAAALAAAGLFWSRSPRQGPAEAAAPALSAAQRDIVAALAAALLAGALPAAGEERAAAVARAVDGVGVAIAGLSAAAQKELGELFALLGFAPARLLLARLRPGWRMASPEEVAAFLQGWRESRFLLLRSAYAGLHDLVLGAWYGNPDTWAAIGYPGPPRLP